MDKKGIRWLYRQLPDLVQDQVLSAEAAEALRQHYGPLPAGSRSLGMLIFAVIGALLIGQGIILLIAHNWEELGRPIRAVLSILPLLIGQGFCLFTLWRNPESAAWREASSAFLALAIGASIALVSQTYHIPGDFGQFMLVWSLLALPLVYLLPAVLPATLCAIGLTVWGGWHISHQGDPLWIWPALALLAPALWQHLRTAPRQWPAVLLLWVMIPCLLFALGYTLDGEGERLWLPIFVCLLSALPALDRWFLPPSDSRWRTPLVFYGWSSVLLLFFLLTFEYRWSLVREHLKFGTAWEPWLIFTLCVALWVAVSVRDLVRREWSGLLLPLAGVIALLVSFGGEWFQGAAGFWLCNLYLLVMSIGLIRSGLTHGALTRLNGGLILFAVLVTQRFFDQHLSFTLRGLLFILLGCGFIAANVVARRRKGVV